MGDWRRRSKEKEKRKRKREIEGEEARLKSTRAFGRAPGGKDNDRAVMIATPLLAFHWLGISFFIPVPKYRNKLRYYHCPIAVVVGRGKRDWSTHTVGLNPTSTFTGYIDSVVKDGILISNRYSPYLYC